MHSTRPTPPANKKLCSTLSLPDNESVEGQLLWVPRASSVWQPIENFSRKPRSASFPDETRKPMEPELGTINNEMNSMSTPPASPTPRPASAYAALHERLFVDKNENKDCRLVRDKDRDINFNWKPSPVRGLPRCRSQPCFDRKRSGVKRPVDEELDEMRPALDLAKMEEVLILDWIRFKTKVMKNNVLFRICDEKLNNHLAVLNNSFYEYFTQHRFLMGCVFIARKWLIGDSYLY